ncbi:MAG: iduronate 2-sulfatase [Planctomycetota bacterium]|jgi:iduronate 2-sulfatase
MNRFVRNALAALALVAPPLMASGQEDVGEYNVLFIISDDLTATALSCYGSEHCDTPNIDRLAASGVRFTSAYCQGTYCGPSRASFMSGYYPHAIKMLGYKSPRPALGERTTWAGHFRAAGYHTTRVSKIFHMGVPGGIEAGTDGADDPISWTTRYNSQGPEWKAPGKGETLEGNPDGSKPVMGGNTFVIVAAEGDDLLHSDGKTAQKACELIAELKDERFFMGVGFVRPHVPFVAPEPYFEAYPFEEMPLPEKVAGDWDDIPAAGINYKTSMNMKMDVTRQKKAVSGYFASVAYMDAQVGKVMTALEESGVRDETIVIFTSDHGYHLGEHDFWAKVSLHEESVRVPLIISVPGKEPAVCGSLTELLDLYPTLSSLCGLSVPKRIQGKDISPMLDDPSHTVRSAAFSVNGKGFLLREEKWAYMQYAEDASKGVELFDMEADPAQLTNLAHDPDVRAIVERMKRQMKGKLAAVRSNDLGLKY